MEEPDAVITMDARSRLDQLGWNADPLNSLAARARHVAKGFDAIFHGAPYPSSILAAGEIIPSAIGDCGVFFTRCPFEAEYWARLPRDGKGERAAIFVIDRQALKTRYRLVPFHATDDRDEAEDRVWDRAVKLKYVMVGMVGEEFRSRSKKDRMLTGEYHRRSLWTPKGWPGK